MPLIVKVILLGLVSILSGPAAVKTQYFVHLSFHSILGLINGISSDLQKLLKCFNGTAIVAFPRIPFAPSSVFLYNLALCSKDLKLLLLLLLLYLQYQHQN